MVYLIQIDWPAQRPDLNTYERSWNADVEPGPTANMPDITEVSEREQFCESMF